QPNPFVNKTVIGFHLPDSSASPAEASAKVGATLSIYDETGRTVFTQSGNFAKGYNTITIDRALLNTTGMLYYKLETATDSATKKMIQTK
ncbi:MAG: T9SS type A sorting domain-containing protein, partial [Bacteroidota bacterium]